MDALRELEIKHILKASSQGCRVAYAWRNKAGDVVHVLDGYPTLAFNGTSTRVLPPDWFDHMQREKAVRPRLIPPNLIEALELGLNYAESLVYLDLLSEGYEVLRGGWPDLLAVKDGSPLGVEVKAGKDVLNERQVAMHDALRGVGFPVVVRQL